MGHDDRGDQELYGEQSALLLIEEYPWPSKIISSDLQLNPILMTLKRCIDIGGSLVSLICLAPIFFLIAVLIKCESSGPILYRQVRVGRLGVPFVLLKFRSMHLNAEREGIRWAGISDGRITRVGRWLRKPRLDELPQLFNVLRGDMSLIGPRPERPYFMKELRAVIPFYDLRHTVRPGITGWAQTCFPYAASVEESHIKLQYDLHYVRKLSLWLDVRILIRTFQVVCFGTGAR